jgi:hypothetical protein
MHEHSRSRRTHDEEPDAELRTRIAERDAGLDLVRRANHWLVAGAVGVTGAVSLWASHSFHAHHHAAAAAGTPSSTGSATSGTAAAGTPTSETATAGTTATTTTGTATTGTATGPELQPSATVPTVTAPQPVAPVVSGGS